MRKIYGFTLAETLLTIMIIGVIAAATLPTLQKAHANKFEAMRTKCLFQIEQTVAQMLDDDVLYPQSNNGFSKGLAVTKEVKVNGVKYGGNKKFCEFFASKFNKAPNSRVNCSVGAKTFTSADGVDWYLPVSNFTGTREIIKFDVNGFGNDPDCKAGPNCPKPDIFEYYITPLGKIYY